MTDSGSNQPLEMLNELSENIEDSKKSFLKRLGFKGGKFKLNNSQSFYAALGLVLLIIGAAVATFLTGNQQDLRQQAEVEPYNCSSLGGSCQTTVPCATGYYHATPGDSSCEIVSGVPQICCAPIEAGVCNLVSDNSNCIGNNVGDFGCTVNGQTGTCTDLGMLGGQQMCACVVGPTPTPEQIVCGTFNSLDGCASQNLGTLCTRSGQQGECARFEEAGGNDACYCKVGLFPFCEGGFCNEPGGVCAAPWSEVADPNCSATGGYACCLGNASVTPPSPTPTPGQWQGCGSCDTCGHPGECVTDPNGACLWDPTNCGAANPTATPGQGGNPTNTPRPTNTATPVPTNTPIPTNTPTTPSNTPAPDMADLRISKVPSNQTPQIGDIITFTISLTNDGPATATNIVVEEIGLLDQSASGFQYISGSANPSMGSFNESTKLWTIPSLSANTTATLTVNVLVLGNGSTTNHVQVKEVDQEDPDSTPGNFNPNDPGSHEDDDDTSTITPVAPSPTATPGLTADLELIKSVDDTTPTVGQSVTYTITLVNKGPDTASGIVVSDVIQPTNGLEYLSHVARQGTYNPNTGIWTVGSLAANTGTTLEITFRVLTSGQIVNLAQVTEVDQNDPDSTPGDGVGDDADSTTMNPVVPTATPTLIPGTTATNTPVPTATPVIGCNQSCANVNCAKDQNLVCVDVSSSGTADFRCRIATNISDPNCGNPVVTAPAATLPPAGQNASTTLVLITAGVVVLVLGALGLLLLL